jgi:hypothetical protein
MISLKILESLLLSFLIESLVKITKEVPFSNNSGKREEKWVNYNFYDSIYHFSIFVACSTSNF